MHAPNLLFEFIRPIQEDPVTDEAFQEVMNKLSEKDQLTVVLYLSRLGGALRDTSGYEKWEKRRRFWPDMVFKSQGVTS